MVFLAILVFLIFGRFLRGCTKGVLVLLLFAFAFHRYPGMATSFWELVDTLTRKGAELLNEP
jgi:hypothetical protein